jgi:hypothetical protein
MVMAVPRTGKDERICGNVIVPQVAQNMSGFAERDRVAVGRTANPGVIGARVTQRSDKAKPPKGDNGSLSIDFPL